MTFSTYRERGKEDWELAGGGDPGERTGIESGVVGWDYPWWKESGGRIQLGESVTRPFRYLEVYGLQAENRRIVFAVAVAHWNAHTFYRRL